MQSPDICLGQPNAGDLKALPLSPAPVPAPGVTRFKPVRRNLRWEGREYPAPEAIDLLMGIVANRGTEPAIRAKALHKLGKLGRQLRGTDRIRELVDLYDGLSEQEEKCGVAFCLLTAEDPHGLPLFTKMLDEEQDNVVRLWAVYGLAEWNVRRGVSELVQLMERTQRLANGRTVRDEARGCFSEYNRRNGWGFPEDEIRKSLEQRSDLSPEERAALWLQPIKEWLTENEHRFPDWKPGDPLPEVPADEEQAPADAKE